MGDVKQESNLKLLERLATERLSAAGGIEGRVEKIWDLLTNGSSPKEAAASKEEEIPNNRIICISDKLQEIQRINAATHVWLDKIQEIIE